MRLDLGSVGDRLRQILILIAQKRNDFWTPTPLGCPFRRPVGPSCLRRLRVEFPAPVFDDDWVIAGGRVRSLSEEGGSQLAECDVWLDREDGTRAISGVAWVALPEAEQSGGPE